MVYVKKLFNFFNFSFQVPAVRTQTRIGIIKINLVMTRFIIIKTYEPLVECILEWSSHTFTDKND